MGRTITALAKPKKAPAADATVEDSFLGRYATGSANAAAPQTTLTGQQESSIIRQSSQLAPAPPSFGQTPAKKPPNPNDVQQDQYNSPVQNLGQPATQGAQQTPVQALAERYGTLAAQQSTQTVQEQAPAIQKQAEVAGAPAKADGIPTPSAESQATWARPLTDSSQPVAGPTGFVSFQQRYGANAGAAAEQAGKLAQRVGRTAEVAKDALAREGDPSMASQGTRDKYATLEDQADALGSAGGIEALLDEQGAATGDDAMFAQQAGGATLRGLADRYGNAEQDLTDAEAAGSLAKDEASLAAEAELARQQGEREAQSLLDSNDAEMERRVQELMDQMGYTRERAEREIGGNRNTTGMARAEG